MRCGVCGLWSMLRACAPVTEGVTGGTIVINARALSWTWLYLSDGWSRGRGITQSVNSCRSSNTFFTCYSVLTHTAVWDRHVVNMYSSRFTRDTYQAPEERLWLVKSNIHVNGCCIRTDFFWLVKNHVDRINSSKRWILRRRINFIDRTPKRSLQLL